MGVHDGHRDRLRDNFLAHRLEPFNELNALELLLFYAIPRRDTNPIAHALLDHFGSLSAVLDASEQELCQVPGVGKSAAALIRLIPQLMRKSEIGRTKAIKMILTPEEAGQYFIPRFLYERDEVLLMACLDTQNRVISCVEISRGVVDKVNVDTRRIVETALKFKSASVILAHNHPDGYPVPSREDDYETEQVSKALKTLEISLFDHIVVSGEAYSSYRDSGFFRICL